MRSAYPRQLESLLNKKFHDRRYEVISVGVTGATILDEYILLNNFILNYTPNIVIVQTASNDVVFQGYNLDPIIYCDVSVPDSARLEQAILKHWKLADFLFMKLTSDRGYVGKTIFGKQEVE
jgi:hypothetical protein